MLQTRPLNLAVLFTKPDLSPDDTRGDHLAELPAICACGEEEGAAYYAWWHNRSGEDDTPVLIEFSAPVEEVAIDGRDFLCTVFQLGKPELSREILLQLFGARILHYAEPAWSRKDNQYDIAMCDLAALDPEIITAHHANRCVIGGRHRTVFRSAFTVRLPITSANIRRVWSPKTEPPPAVPQILLTSLI
jgi:hypothetical protein